MRRIFFGALAALLITPLAVLIGPSNAWGDNEYDFSHSEIAAKQGDAMAQLRLGWEYSSGEDVPKNDETATAWFRKALVGLRKLADQGDAIAQLRLGEMYRKGEGTSKDDKEAGIWFEKSRMGLQTAADQGDAKAQEELGDCAFHGTCLSMDDAVAADWYRKAAMQGDSSAGASLGSLYSQGKGVPHDDKEALFWYRKAAEQGEGMAQANLGSMYIQGEGVPENYVEGYKWQILAGAQGWANKEFLEKTRRQMTPAQVAEAQKLASHWKAAPAAGSVKNTSSIHPEEAGEQVSAEAEFELGRRYDVGQGVPQDYETAAKLYHKAVEAAGALHYHGPDQWDADAADRLGAMYSKGQGVPKDSKKSARWFSYAVNSAFLNAPEDPKEVIGWYRKAANQGYAYGQVYLGRMYADGTGVPQDSKDAVTWYRKAAEQGDVVAQGFLCALYSDDLFSKDHDTLGVPVGAKVIPTGPGPGGLTEDDAVHWCNEAAYNGDALAQYELGRDYEYGMVVGLDDREAAKWYKKAADQEFVPKNRAHNPGDLWDDAYATRYERRKKQGLAKSTADLNMESVDQVPAAKMIESDVDKPGYTMLDNPNNFAVIIGVDKYTSLPAAEFAERDADAVRATLTALGYPARNIYFLSGQQATRAKIDQAVNTWLPNRVSDRSTVFFYYSGHGAPDPKNNQVYLVPVDGDAEDLGSTAYPVKQLYAKLGGLKAHHVIVALDSCFSGTGGRSVLAKGTRPLVSDIDLGGLPDNVIALTASDKNEISGTIEDQGHGAFTYYMLKGLAGAAKNASGAVTVQSLYDYLTPKVEDAARLHNRDQTPQLLPIGASAPGAQIQLRPRQ